MVLYSITFNVEKGIEKEWLHYIKEAYIPLVLKTGHFKESKVLRLLNEELATEGITYSLQYLTDSVPVLTDFRLNYEAALEENLYKKFAGNFVFFKTWLEEV